MSTIGRIYRAGRYARKAAYNAEMRKLVSSFEKIEFNLNEFREILDKVDLKVETNQAFVINEWNNEPLMFPESNEETLQQMKWIDMGSFRLSLQPVLKEYSGLGVPIQFIFWRQEPSEKEQLVTLYAELNDEALVPDEKNIIGQVSIFPGVITILRGTISRGFMKKDNNNFLLIMSTPSGFIQQRVIISFDFKDNDVNDYQELKKSSFLGLSEQKHVHPKVVKKIAQFLFFGNLKSSKQSGQLFVVGSSIAIVISTIFASFWPRDDPWSIFVFALVGVLALIPFAIGIQQLRILKKAIRLKIIHENAKNLENINYEEPFWIHDVCQISDYWTLNENASDILQGVEMI